MLVKTMLNRCYKFKSFVYGKTYWEKRRNKACLLVEIFPRKNSHPVCSKCHKESPGYILLPFEFSSEKKFTFLNNYFKIFLKGIFYSEDKEVYENFFK